MDEIHAEQQQHIGRPPQDDKFQKTKIKPEFDKSLEDFTFVSKKVIQEEIVEVLKKVGAEKRQSAAIDISEPLDFKNETDTRGGDSCLSGCHIM